MTSEIVFEVVRLWLYIMIHFRENEHESGHTIQEGSSRYDRRQQEHQNT